jgi:hypothetical protein
MTEKNLTMNVAGLLGVKAKDISQYLKGEIGDFFNKGDCIASRVDGPLAAEYGISTEDLKQPLDSLPAPFPSLFGRNRKFSIVAPYNCRLVEVNYQTGAITIEQA